MKHRFFIVKEAIAYMGVRGLLYGAGFGAVYGMLLSHIRYGSVYGAFYGALVGIPVGIIGGFLIGIITVLFFSPVKCVFIFRYFLPLVGGIIGFCGAFVGFALLFGQGAFAAFFPSLIATGCAIYVSSSYANRYLEQYGQLRKEGIA